MKFLNINVSMLKAVVLAASLTAFSGPASAILIGTTEVGNEDNLLGEVNSTSSGIETEETLLEGFIGGGADVELVSNVNTFTQLVGGGFRAIDVTPDEPGFFVLKFGAGNCNADPDCRDMFFFANLEDLNYLVWSDANLIANGLPSNHIQSLSHYAITEGSASPTDITDPTDGASPTDTVPEPSTLFLLGAGLIGIARFARKLK